jgi:uncharacterized membrane protein YtjA (UPF0391 family)
MGWAIVFLIAAVLAAIAGFGFLVATAAAILKLLFFIFVVLFAVKLISRLVKRV